jgi:hypothetical protein
MGTGQRRARQSLHFPEPLLFARTTYRITTMEATWTAERWDRLVRVVEARASAGGSRGYSDCLEHPGEEASAAGRRYDESERGSILRRFVRRHCLPP